MICALAMKLGKSPSEVAQMSERDFILLVAYMAVEGEDRKRAAQGR